jgi:NADP-dependent aldehyde dehydrogenase
MNPQVEAAVNEAANVASAAFRSYAGSSAAARARLLREIATGIEQLGEALVECVHRETALPAARIASERARTCMQLRLFADLAEQDTWSEERIDAADPGRTPPRPQVRSRLRPMGPAAVFAASNFPLAFSVAGGDTAAALAVGCPVIVKAHPAHPQTSAMVAQVIHAAVATCGLPAGTFALLSGDGIETGLALAKHPAIKVAAFTGSQQGGLALWRAAQQRGEPIPFFAEMGSVNPVFLFPGAVARDANAIAAGLHTSITLGVGQFCTQPGVIFVVDDSASRALVDKLAALTATTPEGVMLSPTIGANYARGASQRCALRGVRTLARVEPASTDARAAGAALFVTDAATFLDHGELTEELFGPSSLVVICASTQDFKRCAESLRGQLTGTIWSAPDENDPDLLWLLEQKVGRIVFNGFPTGVEVGAATMHGGPFPATTDSRFTSVGTRAIHRFVRPVAWQTPAA